MSPGETRICRKGFRSCPWRTAGKGSLNPSVERSVWRSSSSIVMPAGERMPAIEERTDHVVIVCRQNRPSSKPMRAASRLKTSVLGNASPSKPPAWGGQVADKKCP